MKVSRVKGSQCESVLVERVKRSKGEKLTFLPFR